MHLTEKDPAGLLVGGSCRITVLVAAQAAADQTPTGLPNGKKSAFSRSICQNYDGLSRNNPHNFL